MCSHINVQDLKKRGGIQVMAVKLSPSFFNPKHTFMSYAVIFFIIIYC